MHKFLLVICCFLFLIVPIRAQEKNEAVQYDEATIIEKQISKEDLDSYREDPDYNYEVIKSERTFWDDFKDWINNLLLRFFEWLFGGDKAVGYLAIFLRVIPYILLGILVFILIKFFLRLNANTLIQAKKDKAIVALSEEEHIIKNEDIQALIRKALEGKNYRLAVRYYYLLMLQLMKDKELIEWQLQKTNEDYLKELGSTPFQGSFRKITRLYDYIWYGNFELDEVKYIKAEHAFEQLQKNLKNG